MIGCSKGVVVIGCSKGVVEYLKQISMQLKFRVQRGLCEETFQLRCDENKSDFAFTMTVFPILTVLLELSFVSLIFLEGELPATRK